MKKISFVVSSLTTGGAERVISVLANNIVKMGYEVEIYTILTDEEVYPIDKRVKHTHIYTKYKNPILRKIDRALKLHKLLKKDKTDGVVAFDRYYGIFCSMFTGNKIIGAENNDPYSNMRNIFEKKFRDFAYNRTDLMVFQTDYAKEYFSKKIQDKGTVIPNPINTELPERHKGKRKKEIINACRLEPQKNLPMLFDAFEMFNKEYPDYKLIIYGEGKLRDELQKIIDEKGLQDSIKMPGFCNNLAEELVDAAMYVSSSDFEGISNSMLEALVMGVPAVCTDCPAGGAGMAIQSGENGMLTPVRDADAFYKAMKYLIDNPEMMEKISINATKTRERFSPEKISKMWVDLCDKK